MSTRAAVIFLPESVWPVQAWPPDSRCLATRSRAAAPRAPRWDWSRRAPTSIGGCSAHSSNTWAAPFTLACTNPAHRSPTNVASARTRWPRSRTSPCPSCDIRVATSSPGTTGSTESAQARPVPPCSNAPGTRSRPTSSAPTSSWTGRGPSVPSHCSVSISARAPPRWRWRTSSTATTRSGTKWSDLRRSHGYEQPHKVKYWCLGNEMDGPWQIGRLTGREYGRKARDIAQQARVIDPDVQLIACGSSSAGMPTYLEWDREVLEECYDMVDGLSLHAYYGNSPTLQAARASVTSR